MTDVISAVKGVYPPSASRPFAVDPHRGAVIDCFEVQQQFTSSRAGVSNSRRYQSREYKPVSPIPLAAVSGLNGTRMVRSHVNGGGIAPALCVDVEIPPAI